MHKIARVLFLALVTVSLGFAHTVDTVIFRAVMTTDAEVPAPTGEQGSGAVTIYLHLTRDDSGAVTSGVVDFDASYNIQNATNLTGFHIHEGPAGVAAGVVISSGLSGSNPVAHAGGAGRLFRQVVVTDPALLNRILAKPDGFYANIHTSANGSGLMRGQLARADLLVLRAVMLPDNEVPPIGPLDASGAANIVILAIRDGSGQITSGSVTFDVNYRFAQAADPTAMHIHNGPAGVAAGVVVATDLRAGEVSGATTGNITKTVEVSSGNALTALRGLFVNPAGYYVNLHTTVNPGGAMRGQLQYTSPITLRADMSAANEVPAVTGPEAQATGAATVTAYVTRNRVGAVTSGTVVFDVLHQFPASTQLVGLHIHNAAAGAAGSIVIQSGVSSSSSVTSPTGVGNIYRIVNIDSTNKTGLDGLNNLLAKPDQFYINLHTPANPSGALRGQMGPAIATPPQINTNGIISAVNDATLTTASPGALITIYGTNLAATSSDGGGVDFPTLPISIDDTAVGLAGLLAPLLYVSPLQINLMVPFEAPNGNVEVFVKRADSFGPPTRLTVKDTSPAIFVTVLGAAVLKNVDFSLVSASNPATAGEVLSIFCTGLGKVTPPLVSGNFQPLSGPVSLTVVKPAVTIGGANAEVLASSLAPGFAGLYQVAVSMPSGVPAGNQPVVISTADGRSNAAPMAVK